MISKKSKLYCSEDFSLIENYEKAINDKTQTYVIHHKLEMELNLSVEELKKRNLYYNRPACELIYVTKSEHGKIHNGVMSIEKREKISKRMKENNPMKNKEVSRKVSEKLKGTHHNHISDYQRAASSKRMKENNPMKNPEVAKKVSQAKMGSTHTKETREKLSKLLKGRIFTEEHKEKIKLKTTQRLRDEHGKFIKSV